MGSHSEPRSLADDPDATEGKSEDKSFLFEKHTGSESGEKASGELCSATISARRTARPDAATEPM